MKKPLFTLSRKNQKGQVAIFVALIFQILFVFFAILINVGLLVHHKINLQQSADLAAYYGAMKQAESLNAIAHINFQIKQAWKLLAWRYRIVGSFGFQKTNDKPKLPVLPVTLNYGATSVINSTKDVNDGSCEDIDGSKVNTATHPFFCIGHGGMKGWRGGPDENNCKINCGLMLSAVPYTVNAVPNLSVKIDNGISNAVNISIDAVNSNLKQLCESVSEVNIKVLAKIIISYRHEMLMRSQTLMMLAGNLSNEKLLDLDGNEVLKGVENTFRNNLTEANLDSGSDLLFKTYNSLSNPECAMEKDVYRAGSKKGKKNEFLKRIEFSLIEFFVHDCNWKGNTKPNVADGQEFSSGTIYNEDRSNLSDGAVKNGHVTPDLVGKVKGKPKLESNIVAQILQLVNAENEKYTVGYEKNPWCPAYYFVTASSAPTIPFLPLIKIKLSARAAAKPFGGTIGPWFGKVWNSGAPNTQEGITYSDQGSQLDTNLPIVNDLGGASLGKTQFARLLPNFSRFVGDKLGLSDPEYIAEYHAALINRKPDTTNGDLNYGSSKSSDSIPGNGSLSVPGAWPSLNSWDDAYDITNDNYDPLTKEPNNKDSYFRDLEISAIAPNQFDLTYYSIDPDFYDNYYLRLSKPNIISKLKQSAGMGPEKDNYVRPDLGNNKNIYTKKENFSVRNQLEIVKKIFGTNKSNLTGSKDNLLLAFPYLATRQSSLLTGWTFKNFADFAGFPNDDINSADGTMAFARCKDSWQNENGNPGYKNPGDIDILLPPTPGNCVTGGRVGYSVKLVSPSLLRSSSAPQPLGGAGTSGKILNPIPEDLLNQ